jgi:very-short-patch-repair endonuclease
VQQQIFHSRPFTVGTVSAIGASSIALWSMGLAQQQQPLHSQLTLHQTQRQQGIPTLSVMAGGAVAACRLWTDWLTARQGTGVTWSPSLPQSLFQTWLSAVIQQVNLPQQIVNRLAHRIQQPPDELMTRLSHYSPYQFELFWQSTAPNPDPLAAQFDHWMLTRIVEQQPVTPAHAQDVAQWFTAQTLAHPQEGFRIVTDLLAAAEIPGILVLPPLAATSPAAPMSPDTLPLALITTLTQLAEQVSPLPLSLVLPADLVSQFLSEAPESRLKALLRAGVIELPTPTPETVTQWLRDQGCTRSTDCQTAVTLTARYGATPELLTELALLSQATQTPTSFLEPFRSQAEHFLYQYLQARPETTGLFEVNAQLDIPFGNRPMEVDFLATTARLVVEIDGYYHFQAPEAYRRDRRKDFELQKQGFWVLRFLAEDVVSHLEDILDTICQALACRQSARSQPL